MPAEEPDDVVQVHGGHAEPREAERHGAVYLEEAVDPALGKVDLLLDVAGAPLGGHGEARGIDVEPGTAVRAHPLELAVQAGAEVDVGRAALELVDLVE